MKTRQGFTVVELLVVIAIIVSLAMLTVFAFGSWRKRTATTEVKNEASVISSGMQNERNFKNSYPTALPDNYNASTGVSSQFKSGDGETFCIDVVSTSVSTVYASVTETGIRQGVLCS